MIRAYLSFLIIIFFSIIQLNAQPQWVSQTNPLGTGEDAMLGSVKLTGLYEGWIATGGGKLLHTTNRGDIWQLVDPFPDDTLFCFSDPGINMWWIGESKGWVLFSKGTMDSPAGVVLLRTSHNGTTWEKINLSDVPGDVGIQIQFVDENTGFALIFNFDSGTATFLKTVNGGSDWSPVNGAGIFYFVDENNGWAFTASGPNGSEPPYKIMHTSDGGVQWNEQFSDNTAGEINAIQFTDLNNGWLVGNNGKVLKTTDGGNNWGFITNSGINPDASCKTLFFLDENTGWIPSKDIAENPYIQFTNDGGESWTTQPTPISSSGYNAVFSISFHNAYNGCFIADWGRICFMTDHSIDVNDPENAGFNFSLKQNYPNPFNPQTIIEYSIAAAAVVKITVMDVLGSDVSVLTEEFKTPGTYNITWNAGNLSSGIYFYKLTAGEFTQTRKMMLTK